MQALLHGKEIYNFFGQYELCGILGIIISSCIIGALINKIFKIISKKNIKNYNEFLLYILKNKNSKEGIFEIINLIINIFLLISFYIMMAGLSSYFKQKYEISVYITSVLGALFCYIILNKNMEGIIKISTICVPVIIIFIFTLGIKSLDNGFCKINNMDFSINLLPISIISAFLYAGYNSILLIPVTISLKDYFSKKNAKIIVILISSILILLGFYVYIILLNEDIEIMKLDMPIAYIIKIFGKKYEYLYGIVVIISIFTSIISAGFSFLKNCSDNRKKYKKYLKLMCISSIFISNIGFSELINLLYPIFGLYGIIQIVFILKTKIE